nr:A-kinase anchor protein 12-like [Manis javanica]
MGAGNSTEQRSPEQPEAGSGTPAEPQPIAVGPATEAAPGTPGDPAIAAADPQTKPGEPATRGFPPRGARGTSCAWRDLVWYPVLRLRLEQTPPS